MTMLRTVEDILMTNDHLGFKRFAITRLLYKMCLIALAVPFLASSAIAKENEYGNENATYAIGLWGDLPYSDLQATIGVPNLIADMNSQNLAFTAHNGDLKAGNSTLNSVTPTTCSNDLYAQAVGYFNALKAPAVFTPGDND